MIHVVHVISDLDTGGAEVMLARLVRGMDRTRFANQVVSLTTDGELGKELKAAGIPVESLGMRRARADVGGLFRLIRLLREARPALVQSWLYHADLLAVLASRVTGNPPLVWNLRCSDMDLSHYPGQTRWVLRALALCSRIPAAVVVNSEAGQALHERAGYRPRRWAVIPNGVDVEQFRPDAAARQRLRSELDLPADAIVVTMVARVDPMKDHDTFLEAAGRVARARADAYFMLIGKDTPALFLKAAGQGLTGRMKLLGLRTDVDRLLPGADLACLSSAFGEGFPTVLAEAMACGVPCVTTDVGDARAIVGETGLVVPRHEPAALAGAMQDLINRGPAGRAILGQAARARIEKSYALPRIIEQYQSLYGDLCGRAS